MSRMLEVIQVTKGGKNAEAGEDPRRVDKRGNPYNYIRVAQPQFALDTHPFTGEPITVRLQNREWGFKAYPAGYLMRKQEDGSMKGLPEFGHDLKVGQWIYGDIVTRELAQPQFIPSENGRDMGPDPLDQTKQVKGNYVTFASRLVVGNSDDKEAWEIAIKRAFRDSNLTIKGEGMPLPKHQAPVGRNDMELEEIESVTGKPAALTDPNEIASEQKAQIKVAKTGDKDTTN